MNQEVQLKLRKNGQNKRLKLEDRNQEPQENPNEKKAAIRWSHINRWKQTKAMEGSEKKTLDSPENTKISDVFHFNQLVEPPYSTDGEQNAQCYSKRQCQQVLKHTPQLIMYTKPKKNKHWKN